MEDKLETQALDPNSPEYKFEELTEQKMALWEQIVSRLSPEQIQESVYVREPEWEEIQKLDAQLLDLRAQIEGGR